MEPMKEVLKESGFQVNGNKVTVPEGMEDRVAEYLEKANQVLEQQESVEIEVQETEDLKEITVVSKEDSASQVDFYEKILQNKNGEDVLVRLSIVKQNDEESQFERLVNVTYMSKQTGMVTSNQVFGYEDGYQFDKDVLPTIIDGFQRNVVLSGRTVDVDEVNPTKCYLTAGEGSDSVTLDGYYVDGVRSFLDYDRSHNVLGDEEGKVNLSELEEDDVISEVTPSGTFEDQITDAGAKEQNGPKLTKTLGEMPNSRAAFSNWMNLGLFLVIDVVAIAVGIYLLIR